MNQSSSPLPLRLAVAGLGTVGRSLVQILDRNGALIAARAGRPIVVTAVSARNRSRDRGIDLERFAWFDDPVAMAREAEADVVVELIGGEEGPALAMTRAALEAERHVVSANKAMLAHHGADLAALAETQGKALRYEAAVAGGIPIINALEEGLAANAVQALYGILNGTCNYILTTMEATGQSFSEVLGEAQAKGYAEADPSFDVGGIDAAHKLSLLTALAFGTQVRFAELPVTGIEEIEAGDIAYARELGFRIKLLGVARRAADGQGEASRIEQRVEPCLVPLSHPLSTVDDVFNAIVVEGDAVGRASFVGRGAGGEPTASAVLSDLLQIARLAPGQAAAPVFIRPAHTLAEPSLVPLETVESSFYLRLRVTDRPGVIANVAAELAAEGISIESMVQRARDEGEPVPIVLITHETPRAAIQRALSRIAATDYLSGKPCLLPIEQL